MKKNDRGQTKFIRKDEKQNNAFVHVDANYNDVFIMENKTIYKHLYE